MLMTLDKLFVSLGEVIYFTCSPGGDSPPHSPAALTDIWEGNVFFFKEKLRTQGTTLKAVEWLPG